MMRQFQVNLLLLAATLVVGSVLYPLLMLGIAWVVAPEGRSGSLVVEGEQVRGSALIAQEFKDPGYFWPRPSAAKYDASNSQGSNLGASNPALRERVAKQLARLVRYASGPKAGQPVAADLAAWVEADPQRKARAAELTTKGEDGIAAFFDDWLQARGTSDDLERVPADLVTASGSGLDPHITLKGARYQLDRVAATWAAKLHQPVPIVRDKLDALLVRHAGPPLGFLGEPLVNVLAVNRQIAAALRPSTAGGS